MSSQYPETDLPAYCRKCQEAGGCAEACPRPQLLPENLPALLAFYACETQWRTGFDGKTGLDYSACITTLTLYLPPWQAEADSSDAIKAMDVAALMDDLRTIERALLDAWAEKAEKDKENKPPRGDE